MNLFEVYQQGVDRTFGKPVGSQERRDALAEAAMGLCGEAGEVAELIKKHLYQGHPLSHLEAVNELGDVLRYLTRLANLLEVELSTVALVNEDKMRRRYPHETGFTVQASLERKDLTL